MTFNISNKMARIFARCFPLYNPIPSKRSRGEEIKRPSIISVEVNP